MAPPQGTTEAGLPLQATCPIDGYIVDFACYHPKIAVEIDGGQHGRQARRRRDETRDVYLTASGFRVLRFWNCDVDQNLEGLLAVISGELEKTPHPGGFKSAAVPPRQGEGFESKPREK